MSSAGVSLWALHLSACLLVVLTLLSPCQVSVHGATLSAFGSGRHDGVQRVEEVCPTLGEGVTSTEQGSTPSVVYFNDQDQGKVASQAAYTWSTDRQILEETAQALESRGVKVAIIDINKCPQFAQDQDVAPGAIHVYRNRKYVYQGLHSSDALVSFVLKVDTAPVKSIDSKAHKKAFDKVEGPRLVGLLKRNSKEYEEFARAAEALHPYVSCHIVSDATVLLEEGFTEPVGALKHLKGKTPGTILYYEPYGENPTPLPGQNTAIEILQYFKEHQLSFLRRLYPYDIYATMHIYESSRRLVLAFLLPKTPEGLTLYKSLKRLANTENVGNLKIKVLYVNMDDFPLNIGALERHFKVDLAKPVMGLVNITTGEARWFAKPDLHLLPKEEQAKEVSDWFDKVARDNIRVDGLAPIETEQEDKEEKVVEPALEDGDFPGETHGADGKKSEESSEEKDKDDQEEKDAATPTEKDNDDDDDDDDDDKNDVKAKVQAGHGHKHGKRSAYMRQFDDGGKFFTEIFSLVSTPFRAILGTGESPAGEDQAEDDEDKSETPVENPSTGSTPHKVDKTKTQSLKHKKKINKNNAKSKGAKGAPKQQAHSEDSGATDMFGSIFNDVLGKLGLSSDGVAHGTDEAKAPKAGAASKSKSSKVKRQKVKHDVRQQEHFKPSGKLDTPYMRQFAATENDKIFTNLFNLIFTPIRWLVTPSEKEPSTPYNEQVIVQAVHKLDSPYLRQFAATENDKLFTNTFRFIGNIVALPYTALFGSSSEEEAPVKPKEVRCEMFKATEEDKIFKRLFSLIYSPVSHVVRSIQGLPVDTLFESSVGEETGAQEAEEVAKKPIQKKEEKPKKKEQKIIQSKQKQPKVVKKVTKEQVQKIKKVNKQVKKAKAPANLMAAKKQSAKAAKKPSQEKIMPQYGDESDKLFKSLFSFVKNLVTGDTQKPGDKAQVSHVDKVKVKAETSTEPKETSQVSDESPVQEDDTVKEEKAETDVEEKEEVKDEKSDEKKEDDDDDDDDDDDAGDKEKDDKKDDKDDDEDKEEGEKEDSDDASAKEHGSKMDSEYLKQFKAESHDKIVSHIFKSTIGQLVGSGPGEKAEPEKAPVEEDKKDDADEPSEEKDDSSDEAKEEHVEEAAPVYKHGVKDSDYMKKFNAEPGDKIFSQIYKSTLGKIVSGGPSEESESKQAVPSKKDDGANGEEEENMDEESKEAEEKASPEYKLGSKDSDYLKQFKAEPEDKIFSHIFKSTIGQLVQGAAASSTGDDKEEAPKEAKAGGEEPVAKEAKAKVPVRKYRKPVPVPDLNAAVSGHEQNERYKNINPEMWTGKSEDKLFTSIFRFFFGSITNVLTGGGKSKVEKSHEEDGDGLFWSSDEGDVQKSEEIEEDSEDKAETLNALFDDDTYGSDGNEVDQSDEDDDGTDGDFLTDAFKDHEGGENDGEEKVNDVDEQKEEDDEEEIKGQEEGGEEGDEVDNGEDKGSDTEFLDAAFHESEEEEKSDSTVDNHAEQAEEGEEEHGGEEEGQEVAEEATEEDEDVDDFSQADFLQDAFQDQDSEWPEENGAKADDGEDEDGNAGDQEVEEESVKESEEEAAEEEDVDSMSQADFLEDAFHDPEEKEEEKEATEEQVEEPEEKEEYPVQDDEDESDSQSDFLSGVFSEEETQPEDSKPEEEDDDDVVTPIEKDDTEDDDDDDDDDVKENDAQDEKLDAMSTEDFIDMAFTDDDDEDDMFKNEDVFGDDPEYLEKHVSYRPFSEDPRKQFQYTEVDDNDDDENTADFLYEHGEAYDRHRHGRQHL